MNDKVAIILVNWNGFDVTKDCILSLEDVSYPAFDIIVVDNDSQDGSGQRLKEKHPGIILIESGSNLGFTGGNNLGFVYSLEQGYTYSLMLNNDTLVKPDFLGKLVDYLEENPDTGAVQPKILYQHDRKLIWNAGSYFNRFFGFTHIVGHKQPDKKVFDLTKEVDWITGCAFLVRNDVLRQSELLADNMFMYSEDVDLSFRIRALGYKLMYYPEAVIYHIAGISGKSTVKGKEGYMNPMVHYRNQRNRLWILKRYVPWYFVPTVVLFNFFYITMVMGYFILRGRFGKLKIMLKAVKDGLAGSIQYQQHF